MGKELHLVLVGLSLSFDGVLVGENSSKNSVSLCEFFFVFCFCVACLILGIHVTS